MIPFSNWLLPLTDQLVDNFIFRLSILSPHFTYHQHLTQLMSLCSLMYTSTGCPHVRPHWSLFIVVPLLVPPLFPDFLMTECWKAHFSHFFLSVFTSLVISFSPLTWNIIYRLLILRFAIDLIIISRILADLTSPHSSTRQLRFIYPKLSFWSSLAKAASPAAFPWTADSNSILPIGCSGWKPGVSHKSLLSYFKKISFQLQFMFTIILYKFHSPLSYFNFNPAEGSFGSIFSYIRTKPLLANSSATILDWVLIIVSYLECYISELRSPLILPVTSYSLFSTTQSVSY